MIPKVAHFHWSQRGPEMSWLRWVSIRSFRKFHPDWEIRLHPTLPEIIPFGLMFGQEADWTWWEILSREGGWQIATDIVFRGRIPDDWLDCDLNACQNGIRGVYQFAALGASPGNPYMEACAGQCRHMAKNLNVSQNYQAFGVDLLKSLGGVMMEQGGKLIDQPMESFCFLNCEEFPRLWKKEQIDIPDAAIGVHWYGGGGLSRELEWTAGPDSGYFITDLARSIVGP